MALELEEEEPKPGMTWAQIAALMQIQSPSGAKFTVDDSVAPQFQGFLSALEGSGYKVNPEESGGYANRNIRGTSKPSKHASGLAIDVNWSQNPEGSPGNLPANISELAAAHGLKWGGGFKSRSPDPMHFEAANARSLPVVNSGGTPMVEDELPIDPTQPQPAAGQRGWKQTLEDPITRSFLLSAGLQLMTGGWGNGVSQLAAGIGAGAEGAAGTEALMRKQAEGERDFNQGVQDKQLDRENRTGVARIGANSRKEVAEARIQGMLSRTQMNLQKAGPATMLKYRTEARKIVEGDLKNMALEPEERQVLIDDTAERLYSADAARGRTGGTPAPGGGGVGTEPAAPAAAPVAKSKAGAKGQDASKEFADALADPAIGPKMKAELSTPEGQARLLAAKPHLKDEIEKYKSSSWWKGLMGVKP